MTETLSEQFAPVDLSRPELGVQPAAPVSDPWIDEQFAQPYEHGTLADELARAAAELPEELEVPPVVAAPSTENVPPAPLEEDQPQVITLADGSSVTIEKTSKGWHALLDSGTGAGKENFYGKTKSELLVNVASGKINATKKIRSQEKELKKSRLAASAPITPAVPEATPQTLTADDIFSIKTQLESNPDLAFETWFQKKYGMGFSELVGLAKEGREANRALTAEETSREFMNANPDYYPDPDFENYQAVLGYLVSRKLHKNLPDDAEGVKKISSELHARGFWNLTNLQEAFDYLKEQDLLIMAPEASVEETPAPPAVATPVVPAPTVQTPPPARIVRTGPRAGLGIRSTSATATPPAPPAATRPPSVEELDSLSDADIAKLMASTRQHVIGTRRR